MCNWWIATKIIYIMILERGENMSLGQRLVELRKSKQMSQEEVADKLNVTRQTISKWETDQSTPDFDKIIPLCQLFEISSDELLTGKKKTIKKEMDFKENKQKRTIGLVISILLYFLSIVWIMISIPVLQINPIVGSAIFILICGISTCILIYSRVMYKKEKTEEEKAKNKLYKQIEDILGIITVIIYLGISFITLAWHITWIIWLIYALILEIIKLAISLRGEGNEK